jgi:hypothetical protein
MTSKRRRSQALAMVVAMATIALAAATMAMSDLTAEPDCDVHDCHRILAELASFTDWLDRHDALGFIGEVGWPRGGRWNTVADRWYDAADAAQLPVTAWAAGDRWPSEYQLLIYDDRTRNPQASVVEAHPTTDAYRRGVNVAGAEFGLPSTSPTASDDGAYGYPAVSTLDFIASRGVRIVRLPFRWERIQPRLRAELDPDELGRLTGTVDAARRSGLEVVLDLHNYAGYYADGTRHALGSDQLTTDDFVDVWRRLSAHLRGHVGVYAYGLMNEPVGIPRADDLSGAQRWEIMSREAVEAIRGNGDDTTVMVAGYQWSGVQTFAEHHDDPWIDPSLGPIRYEAHHYWDPDHSGRYGR